MAEVVQAPLISPDFGAISLPHRVAVPRRRHEASASVAEPRRRHVRFVRILFRPEGCASAGRQSSDDGGTPRKVSKVNVGEALSKIGGIVLYSSRGCLVTRRGSYVRLMRIVTPKQGDAPPLAEVVFLKDGHRMLTYLKSLDDEEEEYMTDRNWRDREGEYADL